MKDVSTPKNFRDFVDRTRTIQWAVDMLLPEAKEVYLLQTTIDEVEWSIRRQAARAWEERQ